MTKEHLEKAIALQAEIDSLSKHLGEVKGATKGSYDGVDFVRITCPLTDISLMNRYLRLKSVIADYVTTVESRITWLTSELESL
jgi:hypothetical protein